MNRPRAEADQRQKGSHDSETETVSVGIYMRGINHLLSEPIAPSRRHRRFDPTPISMLAFNEITNIHLHTSTRSLNFSQVAIFTGCLKKIRQNEKKKKKLNE